MTTLGILAGEGALPRLLVAKCRAENLPCFMLAFEGQTPADAVEDVPHAWVRLGEVGKAVSTLKKAGVTAVTLAGRIRKPPLNQLGLDLTGVMLMAKIGKSAYGGDDAVLSAIVKFLEEKKFRVLGIEDLLPELLVPQGLIGATALPAHAMRDIQVGTQAALALGRRDTGQAVLVRDGIVIGEEDEHGTDALIARYSGGRGGVLVKMSKPGQERRADLPAIGLETVERLADSGFEGAAVEAGGALLLDRERTVAEADRRGIFLYGVTGDDLDKP